MNATGNVDWSNVEEVRERYAENREKAARAFGTIKVCFVFTLVSSLIPAVVLTFINVFSIFGASLGFTLARLKTADEYVQNGVREMINAIPGILLYLTALWIIGIVGLIAFRAELRKPHRFLRVFYIVVSVVSLALIFIADYNAFTCLMCMVYGLLGFAAEEITLQRMDILAMLSKEPGFPDFLDHFDQTNAVKNTISHYVDYRDKLKERHEKDKSMGVAIQKAIVKENIVPEEFEPGIMPELVPPETFDDYSRGKRNPNSADTADILFED